MKIALSLCEKPYGYIQVIGMSMLVVIIGLAIASTYLVNEAHSMDDRIIVKKSRLMVLERQQMDTKHGDTHPTLEDIQAVERRVKIVNEKLPSIGWSTVRILSWFEVNMPDKVYLAQFSHDVGRGEIHLVAFAPDTQVFSELLNGIEKAAWYKESVLNRRDTSENNTSRIQYEMHITLKQDK